MEIQAIKFNLMMWVGNLQDLETLNELLAVRKKKEMNGHEAHLRPFTKEELLARAIESYKDYEAGNVIDIEDLAKEYGIKL